ncbi:MAG: ferritin family protein [Planctomycetes bacterium]|nr:ferritin family protein [Planctomycetota bacterium]
MSKASIDEILDFAITAEVAASRFYTELAAQMESETMRKAFEDFAQEELEHKATLEGIKQGQAVEAWEVADLKIADYAVDVEPRANMDYQDALILAMKREKAAFRLYSEMAALCHDESIRETFLALAREEAKHKLRFEIEYDQVILKEN